MRTRPGKRRRMDPYVIASLKTEIEAQQMRLSRQPFGTHDHLLEMQRLVAMQNQMERYTMSEP